MSLAHHQQRITGPEGDRDSELEREALMLVALVDHRLQQLHDQRAGAGGRQAAPSGDGEASAALAEPSAHAPGA
jgi:hypothetical protein